MVQETMLRAWQRYSTFRGEASLRTWLYRIATNICLDALKSRRQPRRLRPPGAPSDPRLPVASPTAASDWLEPYPDSELAATADNPEDGYIRQETISLAFCAALQVLRPRARAILILSDVLDWRRPEIGRLLNLSVAAVESALHRARGAMARGGPALRDRGLPATEEAVRSALERFMQAWHANDVNGIVQLLRRDATLAMPPFPAWFQGRDAVRTILALHPFGFGKRAGWRISPAHANGQPAFVLHRADEPGGPFKAFGIVVITTADAMADGVFSALTVYKSTELVSRFGFPLETSAH